MVAFRSPKPSVRVRIFLLLQEIEVWCNGSTLDFGSNSSGSNPDTSTEQCRVGRAVRPWSAKPVRLVRLQYPTQMPLWCNGEHARLRICR